MSGGQREIEELVADIVLRLESDPECDFEELIQGHPEQRIELRRRFDLLRAGGLFPCATKEPAPAIDPLAPIRGRLERRDDFHLRYAVHGEVGRGGMGRILQAHEDDLQRTIAMKVLHSLEAGHAPEAALVGRFLHEARITAQLDHPGIVPVHELGLDDQGQLYFTMRMVKGEDLGRIYSHVATGHASWNQTRALGVLLKVCEALGYAHEKGVIHRDVKPANVMVGRHGEVYVMDWGLARVLGQNDPCDLRLRPDADAPASVAQETSPPRTPPSQTDLARTSDSPLVTRNGDIVGTPAYMPPEQARGELARLGPQSDVYAVGAMLYQLIAGSMPFVREGEQPATRTILRRVIEGPPTALAALAPKTPPELVAICEKAMARAPEQRYVNTAAMAEDLQAFLEVRTVRAYGTGTWIEAQKWIQRNRLFACSLLGTILVLASGSIAFKLQANDARSKVADLLSLSAIQDLKDLEDRADALWPAVPENLPRYEEWRADARVLLEGRAADKSRGLPARLGLAAYKARLAELGRYSNRDAGTAAVGGPDSILESAENRTASELHFENDADRWWFEQLSKLVSGLESLQDEKSGGLMSNGSSQAHGWSIPKRVDFARSIRERTLDSPEARALWSDAAARIAASAVYRDLNLSPILGMLPLGPDPESGLWEFVQLQTGEAPRRGVDGRIVPNEANGLVFVLLPGGRFWMGAQSDTPTGLNFDPAAREDEVPVHEVELSPFLLSKYEMTQGQWERMVGTNPCVYVPWHYSKEWDAAGRGWSALHPVEYVSANECGRLLSWLGLELPTEAQWEYACRAGSSTVFSPGNESGHLQGFANVSDAYAKAHVNEPWSTRTCESALDDGHAVHAEVGSFRANGFGMHDMHGNVWEFCRDAYATHAYKFAVGKNPVLPSTPLDGVVNRGGSFCDSANEARSAIRNHIHPDYRAYFLGLRPAMTLASQ